MLRVAGRRVPKEWRDETLANPVFAGVELQRRKKLEDGSWSEWKKVGPTKINHLAEMFDITQKAENLQYGVDILMVEFNTTESQKQLLQPAAYDFAVADITWYPPTLYDEFIEIVEQQREQQRREARESRRTRTTRERDDRRGRGRDGGAAPGMMPGGGMDITGPGGGRDTDRRGRRGRDDGRRTTRGRARDEKTAEDIEREYEELLIDERDGFEAIDRTLSFWANDDSVEPGNTYQYRMRIGVFNPAAGKQWVREGQEQLNNEVILWSNYTEPTKEIEIGKMIYFFPLERIEGEKTVNIQVSKFHYGKWRSQQFEVSPGESIGRPTEISLEEQEQTRRTRGVGEDTNEEDEELFEVDFSTDALLVDVFDTAKWDGMSVYRRSVFDEIIYTKDEQDISHLGVRSRYWPDDLRNAYAKVRESESLDIEILFNRGDRPGRRSPGQGPEVGPGMMPGEFGPMGPGMPGI